ncbi:hypothetical protein MSPP1_001733 [Malassezia sp. CBS 17886]|nr:hypothetical protein MSPP1_001733 [Malassezia sp. CBS 17886]
MTLLQRCTAALAAEPPVLGEAGTLRVAALFSRPRPVRGVFPLAHVDARNASTSSASDAVPQWQEQLLVTVGWAPEGGGAGVLMYALEVFVYTLPAQRAALVYVSKLDSTGCGPRTYPRSHLVRLPPQYAHACSIATSVSASVLDYFASRAHWASDASARGPVTSVSLHVLARAQAAYLFPSSPENPRKRVLNDAALIRWWQQCLSEVLWRRGNERRGRRGDTPGTRPADDAAPHDAAHAFYLIPGYSRIDSHPLVPLSTGHTERCFAAHASPREKVDAADWRYGHPYSTLGACVASAAELPPLPLHAHAAEARTPLRSAAPLRQRSLATLIPIFPDDPKGRFMNELCSAAHGPGHARILSMEHEGAEKPTLAHRDAMNVRKVLDRTDIDAFWERMGFRQECSAGNAVGVFVVSFTGVKGREEESDGAREVRREGAGDAPGEAVGDGPRKGAPPAHPHALPHQTFDDLVTKYLLQDTCDWSSLPHAEALTQRFYQALERAVGRRRGAGSDTRVPDAAGACAPPWDAQGHIWSDVAVQALPKDYAASVRPAENFRDMHAFGRPPNAAPVRVLSVKRKWRP